jgi:hypothetical protein
MKWLISAKLANLAKSKVGKKITLDITSFTSTSSFYPFLHHSSSNHLIVPLLCDSLIQHLHSISGLCMVSEYLATIVDWSVKNKSRAPVGRSFHTMLCVGHAPTWVAMRQQLTCPLISPEKSLFLFIFYYKYFYSSFLCLLASRAEDQSEQAQAQAQVKGHRALSALRRAKQAKKRKNQTKFPNK